MESNLLLCDKTGAFPVTKSKKIVHFSQLVKKRPFFYIFVTEKRLFVTKYRGIQLGRVTSH